MKEVFTMSIKCLKGIFKSETMGDIILLVGLCLLVLLLIMPLVKINKFDEAWYCCILLSPLAGKLRTLFHRAA
jgi:hypothetical protein